MAPWPCHYYSFVRCAYIDFVINVHTTTTTNAETEQLSPASRCLTNSDRHIEGKQHICRDTIPAQNEWIFKNCDIWQLSNMFWPTWAIDLFAKNVAIMGPGYVVPCAQEFVLSRNVKPSPENGRSKVSGHTRDYGNSQFKMWDFCQLQGSAHTHAKGLWWLKLFLCDTSFSQKKSSPQIFI